VIPVKSEGNNSDFFMRVLWTDEIPEIWRNQLNQAGIWRCELLVQELSRHAQVVLEKSEESVIAVLVGLQWEDFPYMDFRIRKATPARLKTLNQPGHMWVLIENGKKPLKLLSCRSDNKLIDKDLRDKNLPNITM
jgi:hypothetical protein